MKGRMRGGYPLALPLPVSVAPHLAHAQTGDAWPNLFRFAGETKATPAHSAIQIKPFAFKSSNTASRIFLDRALAFSLLDHMTRCLPL